MKLANFSPTDKPSNYEAHPLKRVNGSQPTYEALLRLKTITKQHADMVYRLSVESMLADEIHFQEYTVHILVDAAPLPDFIKVSVIVAIIVMIVLIVIVTVIVTVIVIVMVYACKTGRWCFADRPDCKVTETGSRFEEENPGDIVKENKGNDSRNRYRLQLPRYSDDQGTTELRSFFETSFPNAFDDHDQIEPR